MLVLCLDFTVSAGGKKEAPKPTEFKMGFLTSLSGSFAAVGETQKKGVLLAAEEVNAKGGLNMPWGKVKVTTLIKDDEAKLDVGVRRFRELTGEGINALTGTVWNPMSAAINEETKINPLPYLAGNVPALDSFKKGNPAVGTFSVAFTPWSIGYLAGASVVQKMGKKTIFFVSRADSWGKTIYEGLQAALKQYGGQVIGFAEYPLGTVDFSTAINKALEVKADVFMACQFGGDAIAIFKQAYDMGLHKKSMLFNTFTTNVVGKGIPADALKELYALSFYYYNLEGFDNPELVKKAKEYTEAHVKMFKEAPDAYGTICYMAAKLIFEAVEKGRDLRPGRGFQGHEHDDLRHGEGEDGLPQRPGTSRRLSRLHREGQGREGHEEPRRRLVGAGLLRRRIRSAVPRFSRVLTHREQPSGRLRRRNVFRSQRMSAYIIETKKVSKIFDGFRAVDKVDFTVRENDAVGIIGPNGAGKTTFINILTGNFKPEEGSVFFRGEDITAERTEKRVAKGIIRTFQLVHVFENLSVFDNMSLSYYRKHTDSSLPLGMYFTNFRKKRELGSRVEEALEIFGLAGVKDNTVSSLSLGNWKRLEIAMGWIADPLVFILDEPFAGISDHEIDEILLILKKLVGKKTIIVVEHKLSKLKELTDTLCVMHEGRIIASGSCEETLNSPEVRKSYWKIEEC